MPAVPIVRDSWIVGRGGDGRLLRLLIGGRAFENLVQFSAVEPDAAALGTEINFDALPFGDGEGGLDTDGAVHEGPPAETRGFSSDAIIESASSDAMMASDHSMGNLPPNASLSQTIFRPTNIRINARP